MAKAKEKAVAEEQPEASQEAPATPSAPNMTPAQKYKLDTLKAKADAEAEKRESVLAKVKEEAASYKPGLRGTWLGYTERNKTVSPAIVIAERFEGEGDSLKLILTLWVFSPSTSQPYRAELTY
jgi:hypothetical protein